MSIKGEILLQVMSNDGRQTTTKNYTPREIDVYTLIKPKVKQSGNGGGMLQICKIGGGIYDTNISPVKCNKFKAKKYDF